MAADIEGATFQPTVPIWGCSAPPIDERTRTLTIVCFGDERGDARRVADEWKRWSSDREIPTEFVDVHPDDLRAWVGNADYRFATIAVSKVVGWRLAVCGEEAAVLACQGAAERNLMLRDEIVAYATSTLLRTLYCPECGSSTITDHQSASVVCSGCSRLLYRHDHVSRFTGRTLASSRH